MTSLRLATRQDDNAEVDPPRGDCASLIPFPGSATGLVTASRMDAIQQNRAETPATAGPLQDQNKDDLKFDHDDYTVAWICPLEVEEIAALKMLDVRHQPLSQPENDHNAYTLGSINAHNVVIASLPMAGNTHAARVVTQIVNTFPHVRFGLLVGIGGGVPTITEKGPIRLGHVVVSKPTGTHSGAVQYDHGKVEHRERDGVAFKRTGFLAPPPTVLLGAARKLNIARTMEDSDPILDHLKRIDTSKPNLKRFKCPGIDNDHLYKPEYVHSNRKVSCRKCGCDPQQRVDRYSDDSDDEFEEMDPSENVVVHEGTIASGEWVMKNGLQRDEWAQKDDILCFEMEAAGALTDFPCLVIRGISDYADSHKNDRWHGFAAAVAAAYARELFFHMPVAEVKKLGMTEADVKIMVTETKNLVQSKLDSDIKAWLSPPDPSTNYNAASAKHLDGTGSWFIKSKEFLSWRTTPGPSALWLYGSPGCGKTILTYAVLQELYKVVDCSFPNGTILYYFFDFNDAEKQSPDNLVRSLIFQLCRRCGKAGSHLTNLYQKHERDGSRPSVQSLCTTFQAMLNETVEPIIILDALDECKARNDTPSFGGQRLLEWLGHLQCKLLVTSRREADIQLSIERWSTKITLAMQEGSVNEDIRAYVHQYLQSPHTNILAETWQSEQAILDEIETKIVEKAGGMFRWVACQLDALAEYDRQDRLRAALESLPETLTETYRQILQRIPKIHHKDTARLLQFVVYAKRPLTAREAADALAVTLQHEQPFKEENRPRQILKYCSNLAVISDDNKIRLAHFSVKEYLVSGEDKGLFTKLFVEPEAQASITEVSLAYLTSITGYDLEALGDACEYLGDWIEPRYPFAEYCAEHWMDHARVAEKSNEDIQEKISNFFSCENEMTYSHILSIFDHDDLYEHCRDEYYLPPLYLASLKGLRCAVDYLIYDEDADVNEFCHGTTYAYALGAACKGHDIEILRLLLENGADANLTGEEGENTALMAAISENFEEAIELLLHYGANPNTKGLLIPADRFEDKWYIYPLHIAAFNGSIWLGKTLLQKGAEINNSDSYHGTALELAIAHGHKDMMRLLLQHGAVIDDEALVSACWRGDTNLLEKILDHLSSNASKQNICNEALARSGSLDDRQVIELLLKHGADINAVGKRGETALEESVVRGTESGAIFLLEKGATIFRVVYSSIYAHPSSYTYQESSDTDEERLFQAACLREWAELISVLLKKNTNAQISQGIYDDGLQLACRRGFDSVVKLLLRNGANINAEPGIYGDALQAASAGGHLSIVRHLLERGANANSMDKHGWPALCIASKSSNTSIYEELWRHSTQATRLLLYDPSKCLTPSTFFTYEKAPNIRVYPDKRLVAAGRDDTTQLVRADHPFPAANRKVYFEIAVLDRGSKAIIGLGVCRDELQPRRTMPGWDPGSWGFHSGNTGMFHKGTDYGVFYNQSRQYGNSVLVRSLGLSVKDTIGCCVDYDADQLFFTRNGEYLGYASKAPVGRLFAAIGVAAGARVSFDFGANCPVAVSGCSEKGV